MVAGAGPFLELAGIVCGGAELGRSALIAAAKLGKGEGDPDFMRAKIATARHFSDHCLVQATGLGETVTTGAAGVLALLEGQF
jgi:acyl-CoA dehydrogenase